MPKNIIPYLFNDISQLIEAAQTQAARYVNASLVMLYWQIGYKVNQSILKEERGEYGEKIIKQHGQQLMSQYGRGFSHSALFRMVQFSKLFPEQEIT